MPFHGDGKEGDTKTVGAAFQSVTGVVGDTGVVGYPRRVSSILVASDDIYVQVTATPDASRRPKSIVVLVPRKSIEEYKSRKATKKFDDHSIAQQLANPLAMYLFTHRASFGNFKVTHLFSLIPPPERRIARIHARGH